MLSLDLAASDRWGARSGTNPHVPCHTAWPPLTPSHSLSRPHTPPTLRWPWPHAAAGPCRHLDICLPASWTGRPTTQQSAVSHAAAAAHVAATAPLAQAAANQVYQTPRAAANWAAQWAAAQGPGCVAARYVLPCSGGPPNLCAWAMGSTPLKPHPTAFGFQLPWPGYHIVSPTPLNLNPKPLNP